MRIIKGISCVKTGVAFARTIKITAMSLKTSKIEFLELFFCMITDENDVDFYGE
jgi:hypothetical protein